MKTVLFFTFSTKYRNKDRLDGVYRYIREQRLNWRVQVVEYGNSRPKIEDIVDLWNPVGCIAECGGGSLSVPQGLADSMPVVYLDGDPKLCQGDSSLCVLSDSSEIAVAAAKELLLLNREIYAFVGYGDPTVWWTVERYAAYASAIGMHGKNCVTLPEFPLPYTKRLEHLRKWLLSFHSPVAVFAANDDVAAEVADAAVNVGLKIPEDVALIGVDDDVEVCERMNPTISSVRPDFENAGYICAEWLDRKLHEKDVVGGIRRFGMLYVAHRESTRKKGFTDKRVACAIEFIRKRACDGIGVAEVAATMGCSRRFAEILFARHTERTILQELTEARLEMAKSLLGRRGIPISEIAARCGWSSSATLRRVFAERYGKSPRDWRKSFA